MEIFPLSCENAGSPPPLASLSIFSILLLLEMDLPSFPFIRSGFFLSPFLIFLMKILFVSFP